MVSYDRQSNKARFTYTLSNENHEKLNIPCSHLINNFCFRRETKSDEKLIIYERDVTAIVRTLLMIHVFRLEVKESLYDILYTGSVSFKNENKLMLYEDNLSIEDIILLFDNMIGENFSKVVERSLMSVYVEYCESWKYFNFGASVNFPSAADYIRIYRFFTISTPFLSDTLRYIVID